MTVLKKLYSLERLLGLTKLFWNEGHMVLPLRLIHESEAALAVAASRTTGAATAATLMACDVRMVYVVMTVVNCVDFETTLKRGAIKVEVCVNREQLGAAVALRRCVCQERDPVGREGPGNGSEIGEQKRQLDSMLDRCCWNERRSGWHEKRKRERCRSVKECSRVGCSWKGIGGAGVGEGVVWRGGWNVDGGKESRWCRRESSRLDERGTQRRHEARLDKVRRRKGTRKGKRGCECSASEWLDKRGSVEERRGERIDTGWA